MKKDQVKVGGIYAVKVSGSVQPVRIDRDRGTRFKPNHGMTYTGREIHDGWDGTNLKSGRSVRVRSAQKLRHEIVRNEPVNA